MSEPNRPIGRSSLRDCTGNGAWRARAAVDALTWVPRMSSEGFIFFRACRSFTPDAFCSQATKGEAR
jgi:hypothetical protein